MASNGRLPRSSLAPITKAANGQQAYLRKDAAAAFMAMNAESVAKFGVTLRVASARVAYRTIAEQQYFYDLYRSGRGALAAVPGTSNHGWGLAVDLANPRVMRPIIDRIGAKYGWAKKWSDAPTEDWHLKWKPGKYAAVKKPVTGRNALTDNELKYYDDLLRRRKIAKRNGGWSKISPVHLRAASSDKAWLKARAREIASTDLSKNNRRERLRLIRSVI